MPYADGERGDGRPSPMDGREGGAPWGAHESAEREGAPYDERRDERREREYDGRREFAERPPPPPQGNPRFERGERERDEAPGGFEWRRR